MKKYFKNFTIEEAINLYLKASEISGEIDTEAYPLQIPHREALKAVIELRIAETQMQLNKRLNALTKWLVGLTIILVILTAILVIKELSPLLRHAFPSSYGYQKKA